MKFDVNVTVSEGGLVREGFGDFNGELSLAELFAFTKQSLILTADYILKEEQSNGFDPDPVVIVDGRQGKTILDVSPLGKIDFISRQDLGDIVLATYQMITELSPVVTGKYISSNFVFLNGTQIATDMASLSAWLDSGPAIDDKSKIRFVNIEPYARKLERYGVTASHTSGGGTKQVDRESKTKRGIRVLQPNGTYYQTAQTIKRLYGKNSNISFEFIPGSQLGLTASFAPVKGKKTRTYLYPSILISVKASGLL